MEAKNGTVEHFAGSFRLLQIIHSVFLQKSAAYLQPP